MVCGRVGLKVLRLVSYPLFLHFLKPMSMFIFRHLVEENALANFQYLDMLACALYYI
jgi:hypothetical protein